jgi:hypothetical protein
MNMNIACAVIFIYRLHAVSNNFDIIHLSTLKFNKEIFVNK